MASHQMSSDQVLSMVVEQAIYLITVDVLYSLFGPFGVEQLVVYPPTKSEEGDPCVAADVWFRSAHAAAHALAYWDGRCIYFWCCRLQMWNATPDVLPAPTSPPARTPAPDTPSPPKTTIEESAPVADVSCPTTKSQEVLELIPDTSPACLAMAPITYSPDISRQVAATIVYPEPAVHLNDKELEQLTPAQATPSISIGTYSTAEEVVPPVATTTDVDPKAGLQELDALSVNTSTPATNEVDHGVALIVPNDLAAPTLTRCSMKCAPRDTSHFKSVLHLAVTPSSPTAIVNTFPDQTAMLGNGTKDIIAYVLPTKELQADELQWQPWPPPVRVRIKNMGLLFRPRPWPSFKSDSDAGYPDEPYSISCELIPMEETFSLQAVEIWHYIPDDLRLLLWPSTSPESLSKTVVKEIPCSGTLNTFSGGYRTVQV